MSENVEIRLLADDEEVPFTFPEGFNEMAHALQFLPDDETRKQVLMGLAAGMAMM